MRFIHHTDNNYWQMKTKDDINVDFINKVDYCGNFELLKNCLNQNILQICEHKHFKNWKEEFYHATVLILLEIITNQLCWFDEFNELFGCILMCYYQSILNKCEVYD